MEKHHKLRRPAGSSIHGCNICGKEGHQAAHCPNGTVDWGAKWPPEAFSLDEPIWYSEPNYDEVARVARVWVATKRKKMAAAAAAAKGETVEGADGGAAEAAEDGAAGGTGSADKGGGSGWQTFHDAYGRPYYFNASTNTTSWELPAGHAAPAPASGAATPAAAPAVDAGGNAVTAMEVAPA